MAEALRAVKALQPVPDVQTTANHSQISAEARRGRTAQTFTAKDIPVGDPRQEQPETKEPLIRSGAQVESIINNGRDPLVVLEAGLRPLADRPHEVTFQKTKVGGWVAVHNQYSLKCDSAGYGVCLNDWDFCQPIKDVGEALLRVSRWGVDDTPVTSYYAILWYHDLPLTRAKQVAKMRIWQVGLRDKKMSKSQPLPAIFADLMKFWVKYKEDLEAGRLIMGPRVLPSSIRETLEERITKQRYGVASCSSQYDTEVGDLVHWMKEEPAALFKSQSSFDAVMRRWLDVRSQLPKTLACSSASLEPEDRTATSKDCPECNNHLRLCDCEFCDICGELTEQCQCETCSVCENPLESDACVCEECSDCHMKCNYELPEYCYCYCDKCGEMFDEADYDAVCKCCQTKDYNPRQYMKHRLRLRDERQADFDSEEANLLEAEPAKLHSKHAQLPDICGTYELVGSDATTRRSTEKSEIVISTDGAMLIGRYRYESEVHGLFRTNRVPKYASSEVVQCKVALEDFEAKDGSWWWSPKPDDDPDMDTTDGIIFLGNGLLKIGATFLAFTLGKIYGNAVFGIKTSDFCEDVDMLKEGWAAVHDHCCICGQDEHTHKWRPYTGTSSPPWDERELDDLIDRLRDYKAECRNRPAPPSPRNTVAAQMYNYDNY